ncbi:MAG: YIP1 family protein [Candidatus Aminicenantes bacterium]|nr:YIP1 family protein [Candidatus Aminicenantes bacterium]
MNEFYNDFIGVIGNPAQTIGKIMEKKRWQAVLAVILLLTAIATFLTYPITKVEQAKFIRDSEMADKLSEEQLANLDKFTPSQRLTGAMISLVLAGLMIVVAAFFIYLFFKVAGSEGNYVHYFSGVVHASILDMFLGGILKSSLILMKKTMLIHTGLTMFFPGMDFRSLSFIVLAQFDFFSIWYLAALALGIAFFAKISPQKSISIAVMYFIFKSLVFVSFSYFSMKLMGM